MTKAKILIADDHALMRIGLRSLLESQRDIIVVGDAGTGRAAVALAEQLRPDVVIIDLRMPELDGAEATRQILEAVPSAKIIVLSSFGASAEMARALAYGAVGAQVKESPTTELLESIRKVMRGERAVAAEIAQRLAAANPCLLTDRQMDVLEGIAGGWSDKEIGRKLGISRAAVQKHLAVVFEKLGASNRAEAVARAFERHLIGSSAMSRR